MSLAPEHRTDLRKSGLSDDTIEACQFESVPPGEIRLSGVESAYRFPYFDLDGKPTGDERRKVFPPIVRPNGTQKYHQEADTSPKLYLPPLLDWASIASDPERPLFITEGEKKAAAGCQAGLVVLGVAGVWNWRQKLDTGEGLVIPAIDQFVWRNRVVELVPDSDVWRSKKQQALDGFYALAQELVKRGARVRFIKLPESGQGKVGLDDWLVKTGSDWVHQWPSREQIALDDLRLERSAKWWQEWCEKQTLRQELQRAASEVMAVVDLAGSYQVSFPGRSTVMTFQRPAENARGVTAELTVTVNQMELLGNTDIGLKSGTSRDNIARSLAKTANVIPWKTLIERACAEVLKRHRHGDPIIELEPTDSSHIPFVLNPLVYRGHQTLIFAPGGSYKSYLALYIACLAEAGLRQNGVGAIRTRVLYCDWELDAETVGARLKAIHTGHPELAHVRPYYRRQTVPLHHEAHQIAAEVARLGVGLIIIDSAAMACGGELNSPESAIKLQQALRLIGCASIVLAHVSKATPDGQEKSAYGSVFFRELARNVWELSRPEDSPRVVLSQTGASCKNSFGRKQDPLGFEFSFEPDRVRITSFNPADEEESEFEEKLPTRERVRRLLADGKFRASKDIATETGLSLKAVKSVLSRGKDGQCFTRTGSRQDGLWGLSDGQTPSKQVLQAGVAPFRVLQGVAGVAPSNGTAKLIDNKAEIGVAREVAGCCNQVSIAKGGIYIPPTATPTQSIYKTPAHSQPEEVLDLED